MLHFRPKLEASVCFAMLTFPASMVGGCSSSNQSLMESSYGPDYGHVGRVNYGHDGGNYGHVGRRNNLLLFEATEFRVYLDGKHSLINKKIIVLKFLC